MLYSVNGVDISSKFFGGVIMNRSILVVNHGVPTLVPRGVATGIRASSKDIYLESEHSSSLSLSPTTSKSTGVIPGMQEVFTKFSSPSHPSPILAATLCGYNNQTDNYLSEMSTSRTTSSCVTTPQSLYSDPISSAEAQSNFENSFEASSSSAIDLVDFPSNLMSNALEDLESLDCGPHVNHLPAEACQTIEEIRTKSCVMQMDDEEMDIVPNELVQFVSESTRRIRKEAAGGMSNGDSDLDEMDHDARIASLGLPILQPPSLTSSHISDDMRPPSLSPQSPDNGSLVANHSDDLTAIEFTRAYLSEPADSHSTLTETRDFDTYQSIASITDFKADHDPDMVGCENGSSDPRQDPLSPFSRSASDEMDFHQSAYGQLLLKPSIDSSATETYFPNQGFPELSPTDSLNPDSVPPTMNTHQVEDCRNSSHTLPAQNKTEAMENCSVIQLMKNNVEYTTNVRMGPSSNPSDVQLNLVPTHPSTSASGVLLRRPEIKTTILQNLTAMAPTVNSTCPLKFETGLALANLSSVCAPQSSSEQSSIFSDTLLNDSVAGSRWVFGHVADRELPSRCPTSTVKSEEPMFTQVGTRFVPAPMFCPSAPLITSTRPNITGSFPSSRAIQLVSQTTLSSSAPGTFASPQSSLSFLLTADSNRPRVLSNSLPTDQNSNSNTLNYLNLPLQVLQALPNLRPGMSILLHVKNNRPNGQPNVVTSMPLESHSFSSVNAKKTDGTVFLLPSSQIPVCIASQIQAPQVMPTQRPCQLNSNLNQTVLFMPSISSSSTNSAILSGGSGSLISASPTGTSSGAPGAFPSGTQFLLLRSPAKPDSKPTEVTQVSNVNATSETTFLISTNLSQKTPIKPSGLLLIPHTVPPPVTQQSCTFPNLANQLHFQTVGSNLLDVSTMPSWGYRPPETQNLFGLSSGSACVQLGFGQPNSTVQNALLAAALSRSISNSMTASTLSLPIAVFPSNPQTVLMSPSTSVLQPSSTSNHLLPSHLASFISTTTIANTPVITTGSFSSVNLDPSLKLTMATQPGHSSASVSNIPTSPTASSAPENMIAYVPASTSSPHTSIFPSKKLVVLPSADNLLCSASRSSLSSGCTLSISASCSRANKQPETKFPVLSSDVSQPMSPCVLPSPTGTLHSTKSASPAPQFNTLGHVNYRRRHQCPYCPKSCERKDNLQAHIRTHTGERPYPCRFCPKAFPQKDHLRAHIRTHTGEKPYRCPQCMKAFAQLGNLHRHVKTHKR